MDVAVVAPDLLGQALHLIGDEMVDGGRDPGAAEVGDELGGLLDRLGPVVVGPTGSRAAAGADDRCAGFTQGSCDATPGTAGRSGDDRDPPAKRIAARRPSHSWGHALRLRATIATIPARRGDAPLARAQAARPHSNGREGSANLGDAVGVLDRTPAAPPARCVRVSPVRAEPRRFETTVTEVGQPGQ